MRVSAVAFFEQFAHSADYRFDRAIATYRDADDDGDLDGYVALGRSSEEGHIQQKSDYNAADAAEAEGYAMCSFHLRWTWPVEIGIGPSAIVSTKKSAGIERTRNPPYGDRSMRVMSSRP
jgi:hypothetical protein